jgi:hypothetical protein
MIEAGIAVLFVTAQWREVLASGIGHGCLEKPFAVPVLLEAVRTMQHVCRTGASTPRLPPRLHLLEPSRASVKPDPIRSPPSTTLPCSGHCLDESTAWPNRAGSANLLISLRTGRNLTG